MSPVETILETTMREIKQIVDVNTIVGDPIYGEGGAVVLPVSKVTLGFLTGGGDFPTQAVAQSAKADLSQDEPFMGASVVGVSITPKAFLCLRSGSATLLCADCDNTLDRLVQLIPNVFEQTRQVIRTCKEQTNGDCSAGKAECERRADPFDSPCGR